MAVYTHFDGMPGLWRAVRAEGFERLGRRIAAARPGRDPVEHLASLGVAYVAHALREPDLYRVMFDAAFDLPSRTLPPRPSSRSSWPPAGRRRRAASTLEPRRTTSRSACGPAVTA
jgi:AcrR family transcriptional regulator